MFRYPIPAVPVPSSSIAVAITRTPIRPSTTESIVTYAPLRRRPRSLRIASSPAPIARSGCSSLWPAGRPSRSIVAITAVASRYINAHTATTCAGLVAASTIAPTPAPSKKLAVSIAPSSDVASETSAAERASVGTSAERAGWFAVEIVANSAARA